MKMSQSGSPLPIGRSLYSRAILIDTGALLALVSPRDSNHQQAIACLNKIKDHRLPVFVSLPTIYESHRRFLFDFGYTVAVRFLHEIHDGSINIVRTVEEDEQEAMRLVTRYEALKITLTDGVNMAVMVRLGIATSFSFDRHYLQAGFIRIPPFHLRDS
jgi:predicted nucleic acid-binding protein